MKQYTTIHGLALAVAIIFNSNTILSSHRSILGENDKNRKKIEQSKSEDLHPNFIIDDIANYDENDDTSNTGSCIKNTIFMPPRPQSTSNCNEISLNCITCKNRTCTCVKNIKKSASIGNLNRLEMSSSLDAEWQNDNNSKLQQFDDIDDANYCDQNQIIKILLICPCDVEFDAIVKKLSQQSATCITNATNEYHSIIGHTKIKKYAVFRVNNFDIIVFLSGKYSTTSAISTSYIFQKIDVNFAVIFGLCGALNTEIKLGSICLPTKFNTYDYGRQYDKIIRRYKEKADGFNDFFVDNTAKLYMADEALTKKFAEQLFVSGPPINSSLHIDDSIFAQLAKLPITTNICCSTGSKFVHSRELSIFIKTVCHADIVDMESYGIAEACEMYDVPFAAVRVPSDRAGIDRINHINSNNGKIALANLANAAVAVINVITSTTEL